MSTQGKEPYSDIENMTFEAALEELQELSKKMSDGKMPLAESVDAYSRGVALSKHCQKLLDDAKEKIRVCDQELSKVSKESDGSNTRRSPEEYPEDLDPLGFDDDKMF